jgi:hypothetical protein
MSGGERWRGRSDAYPYRYEGKQNSTADVHTPHWHMAWVSAASGRHLKSLQDTQVD